MKEINLAKDISNIIESKKSSEMTEQTFLHLLNDKYKNDYPLFVDNFDVELLYNSDKKESYIIFKNLFTICFAHGQYLPETIELEKNGITEFNICNIETYERHLVDPVNRAISNTVKNQKAIKLYNTTGKLLGLPLKSNSIWEIQSQSPSEISNNFISEIEKELT